MSVEQRISNRMIYEFSHHNTKNILFHGTILWSDERYVVNDIFPDGFNYGYNCNNILYNLHSKVDVWGVYNGQLFAQTIDGMIYVSHTMTTTFDNCGSIEALILTNDNVKSIITFINDNYNRLQYYRDIMGSEL